MQLPINDLTIPTPLRRITLTKIQALRLTHTQWMLTPSTLKNSLKKKGKNALEKDDASNAENSDTTQETAPRSPITLLTQAQTTPEKSST